MKYFQQGSKRSELNAANLILVAVSKEKLDIYNPVTKATTSEPNTPEGFRKIREAARKARAVVCGEPTGGLT